MVDIHSHILPGLDDGAESLEEALVMARLAVSSGIRHMAATSHGNYYDYTLEEYRESLEKLQEELAKEAIPLKLYPGMEIFLDDDAASMVQRKELLSLNHTDYLLVEFPFEMKKELANGKLMIGESAGAIICAPSIQYIEQMDEKPEDYSQEDDAGIDLIDFYVLPHYLTAPFKKVTEKIMTEFSDLNLCPINNRQGIVIDGEDSKVICKD